MEPSNTKIINTKVVYDLRFLEHRAEYKLAVKIFNLIFFIFLYNIVDQHFSVFSLPHSKLR